MLCSKGAEERRVKWGGLILNPGKDHAPIYLP